MWPHSCSGERISPEAREYVFIAYLEGFKFGCARTEGTPHLLKAAHFSQWSHDFICLNDCKRKRIQKALEFFESVTQMKLNEMK